MAHFYAQEQRRPQQPQVFRIDTTESEENPSNKSERPVTQRPFGINQVPIPVLGQRTLGATGVLWGGRAQSEASRNILDAYRQASEPEAA